MLRLLPVGQKVLRFAACILIALAVIMYLAPKAC
jgi:hypothetical protein